MEMQITKSEYVREVKPRTSVPAAPKPEIVAAIKPYTDQGIDTLFDVTTESENAARDKRFVQTAAVALGVTAREIDRIEHPDENGNAMVTITFAVRPPRKVKDAAPETTPAA